MSFYGTRLYSLTGVQDCLYASVRPSDQSIVTVCTNNDFKNYILLVSTNGTVIKRGSWATIGGAYSDTVYDVDVDPITDQLYAAGYTYDQNTANIKIDMGCRYGTWPNEPPANGNGQIQLAKLYANLTAAWVKLHGPTGTYSSGTGVAFNPVSNTAFMTGYTGGSIDGQTYFGGSQDAFVSAYLSNGTRLWTKLLGTSVFDNGNDIVSYQSGAIHAGAWNPNNVYIEYRLVNGSIGWQTPEITSTCSAEYNKLQYNLNDVYVYVFGDGFCIVDGSPAPTRDLFATRYFVVDGTRDSSLSLVLQNDIDQDYSISGAMDPVTQRIAIGGYTGSTNYAEYATVKMNGSLIQFGVDRLKSSCQVYGMAATNKGVIAFTYNFGATAFMGIDNATFAQSTSLYSTSSTTKTSIGSTSKSGTTASTTLFTTSRTSSTAVSGTLTSTSLATSRSSSTYLTTSTTKSGTTTLTTPPTTGSASSNTASSALTSTPPATSSSLATYVTTSTTNSGTALRTSPTLSSTSSTTVSGTLTRISVDTSYNVSTYGTTSSSLTTGNPLTITSTKTGALSTAVSGALPNSAAATSSSIQAYENPVLISQTSSDQGYEQLSYINIHGKSYPKTITTTSAQSMLRNKDGTVAEQSSTLILFIVIGSIALILTLCAGIAIWRCKTSSKRQRAEIVLSNATGDGATDMQDASRTQSNMVGTDMTAIVTSHELSIPSFLLVDYGTDFKQEMQIASGSQGTVCMVHVYIGSRLGERAKGTGVVGKFSNMPVEMLSSKMQDAFEQEVSLHWMFRDTPGFARVFGYAEKPVATILMEFYPLGSLQPFIEAKRSNQVVNEFAYSKRQVISLLRDCASAFYAMHMKGVVHCDIKSANVLLKQSEEGKLQAVITDFGVARLLSSRKVMVQEFKGSRLVGLSLSYAAPEAIARLRTGNTQNEVNPQVWIAGDVFSTSMMLMEMLKRKGPWDD